MGYFIKRIVELSNFDAKILINIYILPLKEENIDILFCPSLDLYGYGRNKEEADKSFNFSLETFFDYIIVF